GLCPPSRIYRLFGSEEVVAIGITLDSLPVLPRVFGHNLVEPLAQVQDFLGVNFDVARLALKPAHGLVDEHTRVGQAEALALRPRAQQTCTRAGRLPDAKSTHIWLDELHSVIDCQARRHDPARRVDVKGDVLVRVL